MKTNEGTAEVGMLSMSLLEGLLSNDDFEDMSFADGVGIAFSIETPVLVDDVNDVCIEDMAFHISGQLSKNMSGKRFIGSTVPATLPASAFRQIDASMNSDYIVAPLYPVDSDEEKFMVQIATSSFAWSSFSANLINITDCLTCEPFASDDASCLTLQFDLDNDETVDPLALALNADEMSWLERGGRKGGFVSENLNWVSHTLREAIIQRFVSEDIVIAPSDSLSRKVALLSAVARHVAIDNFSTLPMSVSECGRKVIMTHIGGLGFETDFASNLALAAEMVKSIKASTIADEQAYWMTMVLKIDALISDIHNAASLALKFGISEPSNEFATPTCKIHLNQSIIGSLLEYAGETEAAYQVTVGKLSTFVDRLAKVPAAIAILLGRDSSLNAAA
jgi:hypothetical protein